MLVNFIFYLTLWNRYKFIAESNLAPFRIHELRKLDDSTTKFNDSGLQAPSTNNEGIIPAAHAAFVGIFVATGVPIFAFALGQFAGIFVERQ